MKYRVCWTLTVLTLLTGLVAARPAQDSEEYQRQRFETVLKRLLAKMDPVPGMEWPPQEHIVQKDDSGGDLNAFAHVERRDGKLYPHVTITWRFLREVCADDNTLAYVLGHELGHHHHRHTIDPRPLRPMTATRGYGRTHEYEADLFGLRLMQEAGFSVRKGLHALRRSLESQNLILPSENHLRYTHPAWYDRLARLSALLDNEQLALWRSLGSYENGVRFLVLQQYEAAEVSFRRVVREYPKSQEAWVNLGVALLMQYCEQLSPDDLRTLGVGQVHAATFYRHAPSLIPNRGDKKEELWQEALKALRTAADLGRDQPLVLANLGLAYLLHPGGKIVGLAEAERYLKEAVEAVARAEELDIDTKIALLVNLGVARLAGGSRTEGLRLLARAAALEPRLSRGAVGYNRAMALADGTIRAEQTEAVDLFENYLRGNDPALTWWTLAFERYQALCHNLDRPARSRDELRPARPLSSRRNLSVTLADGQTIALTDPVDEIIRRLGEPARQSKEVGSSFRRLAFPRHGLELLVDEQQVVAILLTGPAAPAVTVRGNDVGAAPRAVLRVGMTRKEVEAMPDGAAYVHRPLTRFGRVYHYYRPLNLAVHYDRAGADGVVQELVLAVIPDGDF